MAKEKHMLPLEELSEFYGVSLNLCRTARKARLFVGDRDSAELLSFDKWAQKQGTNRSTREAISHFYGDEAGLIKTYLNIRSVNGQPVQIATKKNITERR